MFMEYVLDDSTTDFIHDELGRVIIPSELLDEYDKRMSAVKLWIRLAQLLEPGQDTIGFDDMPDLAAKVKADNPTSLQQTIRKLDSLGWINRTKATGRYYRGFEIQILPKSNRRPPVVQRAKKKA